MARSSPRSGRSSSQLRHSSRSVYTAVWDVQQAHCTCIVEMYSLCRDSQSTCSMPDTLPSTHVAACIFTDPVTMCCKSVTWVQKLISHPFLRRKVVVLFQSG